LDAVRIRKSFALVLAAVALLALAAPAPAGKGKSSTHKPPYKMGPSGGDEFNYVHQDPESGEIFVGRLFPGVPPVVGCTPEPAAAWGMLRTKHHVLDRVDSVVVNFEGAIEAYAWVTAGVRDERGGWLGVKKMQGPHAGAGKLVVKLHRRPRMHSQITIEFGLQLGDACPQVGGALASFPSIKVN
jgi:hypothetical protein